MKNIIFIIIVLLLNNTSKAQMIKSFDCVISQEDTVVIYHLKVKFDSNYDREKRMELLKSELKKRYQIKADKIISIESFIGKRFLTYLYTVKVKKE